jgi:hypothetical protein
MVCWVWVSECCQCKGKQGGHQSMCPESNQTTHNLRLQTMLIQPSLDLDITEAPAQPLHGSSTLPSPVAAHPQSQRRSYSLHTQAPHTGSGHASGGPEAHGTQQKTSNKQRDCHAQETRPTLCRLTSTTRRLPGLECHIRLRVQLSCIREPKQDF